MSFMSFLTCTPDHFSFPYSVSSIEYWFRCMDLDGDGVLSMYELEYFYDEQCQKLETMAIEPLPFEDCLCQMLDLVKPEVEGQSGLTFIPTLRSSHSRESDRFHVFSQDSHRLLGQGIDH